MEAQELRAAIVEDTASLPPYREDALGNLWPVSTVGCNECGQPDNCGDCDHTPLAAEEVVELGGQPDCCGNCGDSECGCF